MDKLEARLEAFARENAVAGKGPLSVVLVLTRAAKSRRPPFSDRDFFTPRGGQVAGLGKMAVQAVLKDYGIARVLAEEGGRTSRGSIEKMRSYLALLNELHTAKMLKLDEIEEWWVGEVRKFFASQPLRLRLDQSKSLTKIVGEVIEAAFVRQKECQGAMVAGAVIQHLVGAKLQVALPKVLIEHKGFSVADAPGGRGGDFVIEDTVIHVTTTPTESLVRKCCENLSKNLHPIIITTERGVRGAQALAGNADAEDRIDILEIGQFIATNVFEWCCFAQDKRPATLGRL
ncbi:MAG: DUF4928 family protein, partial [Armatimonadetes bacterium]|nr:DUF4928 family protein [Armatimonadota bacterium]